MTDFRDAARLVLRSSSLNFKQPRTDKAAGNPQGPAPSMPGRANPPLIKTSSGTPLMIMRDGRRWVGGLKEASTLRPRDAIRLETGERVAINYVSRGFAPADRYIEWRGLGQLIGRISLSTHQSGSPRASRALGGYAVSNFRAPGVLDRPWRPTL